MTVLDAPVTAPNSARRFLPFALWLLHAVLTAYVAFHHEPWRDEADVWLQVRDRTPAELWRLMGYSGTPGLWHALVYPLAKLGAPYESMFVLHWLVAVAAVGVLLLRAPFSLVVRALLAFGIFLGYEYAVVARSYGLTVLGLFLAAAWAAERRERPWRFGAAVALTANTNVLGLFIASAFCAVPLLDLARGETDRAGRRASLRALALASGGLLLAVTQLLPPADGQLTNVVERLAVRTYLRALAEVFWPLGPLALGLAFAAALLAGTLWRLSRHARAVAFLLIAQTLLGYLFVCKYAGDLRHHGFLLLTMVGALWLGLDEERRAGLPAPASTAHRAFASGVVVCLAFSTWEASGLWRLEVMRPYSNGRAMARWLLDHGLGDRALAAFRSPPAESLLPYLPGVRLYYPSTDEHGTHLLWNRDYVLSQGVGLSKALRRVRETYPDWRDGERGPLLLLDRPLEASERQGYQLLHRSGEAPFRARDESYWLYAPEGRAPAPADAPIAAVEAAMR